GGTTPTNPNPPDAPPGGGGTTPADPSGLTLALLAPRFSSSHTPTVMVRAGGVISPTDAPVVIDVDLNHDGRFDGAGERALASGVAPPLGAVQTLTLSSLPDGTFAIQARSGAVTAHS